MTQRWDLMNEMDFELTGGNQGTSGGQEAVIDMAAAAFSAHGGQSSEVSSFVPSVEQRLVDALAEWKASESNPLAISVSAPMVPNPGFGVDNLTFEGGITGSQGFQRSDGASSTGTGESVRECEFFPICQWSPWDTY